MPPFARCRSLTLTAPRSNSPSCFLPRSTGCSVTLLRRRKSGAPACHKWRLRFPTAKAAPSRRASLPTERLPPWYAVLHIFCGAIFLRISLNFMRFHPISRHSARCACSCPRCACARCVGVCVRSRKRTRRPCATSASRATRSTRTRSSSAATATLVCTKVRVCVCLCVGLGLGLVVCVSFICGVLLGSLVHWSSRGWRADVLLACATDSHFHNFASVLCSARARACVLLSLSLCRVLPDPQDPGRRLVLRPLQGQARGKAAQGSAQ